MATYQPGDYIKVEFKDDSDPIGEWMWVRVESCAEESRLVFGVLDNEPVSDDLSEHVRLGSRLAVSFDKIREHKKASEFTRQ
jgi:hypothetical protein